MHMTVWAQLRILTLCLFGLIRWMRAEADPGESPIPDESAYESRRLFRE